MKIGCEKLPEICREHARQRIRQEMSWFKGMPSAKRVLAAYQSLAAIQIKANQFPLQLGWGTGWDDKTLGSRLQADPQFMEVIIKDFNLSRGKHRTGQPFPASRRAAVSISQSPDGSKLVTPVVPLGWVLVTLVPEHGDTSWMKLEEKVFPLMEIKNIPAEAQPSKTSEAAQPSKGYGRETGSLR